MLFRRSPNTCTVNGLRFYAKQYAPQGSKPVKNKKHHLAASVVKKKASKRSPLNPTPFHYGNFGGLKESENATVEKTAGLLKKITDFEQLKILPQVRTAITSIISRESILNNKNFIQTNRSETRAIRNDSTLDPKSIKPSPIQVAAIKKLSKNLMDKKLQTNVIAAETGSGKTMAYLTPLFEFLKRSELESPEEWQVIKDKAVIRAVILVPTHELVDQVYRTVQQSEELLGFHTFKWDSGATYSEFLERIKSRIDILITTPGKLLNLFNVRMINRPERMLSRVQFVILDEADTLMDQSWLEDTHKAIQSMPNVNHLLFCSATIPNEFNKTMERFFPTCQAITTPKLHRLPYSLDFKLIDATLNPYKGSKMKALAQTLFAIMKDGTEAGFEKRCIVFVNEKKDVEKVREQLANKYNHDCIGLTGEDTVEERAEKVKPFISPPRLLEDMNQNDDRLLKTEIKRTPLSIPGSNIVLASKEELQPSRRLVALKILVTTDLMARGLNFQGVRNVILYDVPKTSIDLVHRVGRTGRMKQSGRVFMITDKSTKSWAKGIPKVVKNQIPLS